MSTDDVDGGRLSRKGFCIPPPSMFNDPAISPTQLAEWGIPSPAPIGWRSYLNGIWHWEGPATHDTVFDAAFQAEWLRIESGKRVPLVNVRGNER